MNLPKIVDFKCSEENAVRHAIYSSKAYLGPCRTSTMDHFCENS